MSTAWATIIGAVVAAAASILVSILNNQKQNSLWAYRLEQLEKKQDRYNNLQERVLANEKDIKHIFYEIDEIKEAGK